MHLEHGHDIPISPPGLSFANWAAKQCSLVLVLSVVVTVNHGGLIICQGATHGMYGPGDGLGAPVGPFAEYLFKLFGGALNFEAVDSFNFHVPVSIPI